MPRERWQQVKRILASLLERPEPERAGALEAACAGDAELRDEVRSLLAAEQSPILRELVSVTAADDERRVVAPGTRLGPYEVAELIGAGGMGEVYRGRDTRLGREVAVKVVGASGADPRRLEREARAASTLNHPNILTLFDVGSEGGIQYVVTELLRGRTLRSQLERGAPDLGTALDWAGQIAAGLEAAHAHGVIHRDLKPENLFVTESGLVKILDFGLAKRLALPDPDSLDTSSGTSPGTLLGTIGYMSPEQVRGLAADARSDVFAFGAVSYELLTGRRAFQGDSAADTLGAILRDTPAPPSTLRAGIPQAVDELLRRCLDKRPDERPASGAELRVAIESLDTRARPRPRAWLRPLAAGLLVGALGLLATLAGVRSRNAPLAIGSGGRPSVAVLAFEDHTADPSNTWLAKGLPSMLVTGLAQTRGLDVLGTERLQDAMAQLPGNPQARGRAMEAARKSGAGALLVGSVLKAGASLRIDVRLEDVASGKVLLAESVAGVDLLALTDVLVARIRAGLGLEEPASARSLKEVTTASLEAYEFYAKGLEARHNNRNADAQRLYREALAIDPSFALAWLSLANNASALGETQAAAEYRKNALRNVERLPERQRLLVEAGDQVQPQSGIEKGVGLLRTLIERYPDEEEAYDQLVHFYSRDPAYRAELLPLLERWRKAFPGGKSPHLHNHYGYALLERGLYTDAQREFEAYIRIRPNEANAYDSLAELFLHSGRPEKALEHYERALSINPLFGWSLIGSSWAHGMLGRYDEAFVALDRLTEMGERGGVSVAAPPLFEAFLKGRVGRYREALQRVEHGLATATRHDNANGIVAFQLLRAMLEFERGRARAGQASIDAALLRLPAATPPSQRRRFEGIAHLLAGVAAARAGEREAAQAHLAALGTDDDGDRLRKWTRHGLEGEISLAAGDPAAAAASFQAGLPDPRLEFNMNDWLLFVLGNGLPTRDGMARARAARGDLTGALDEYARLLVPETSFRWPSALEPRYVLARAILAERSGAKEVAAAERRRFRELWKRADAELGEASVARSLLAR